MFVDTAVRRYDGDHTHQADTGRTLPPRTGLFTPSQGVTMKTPPRAPDPGEQMPLGQRLFDNMFLLLGAGLLIMFLFYTGWGLWEITSLPVGNLP